MMYVVCIYSISTSPLLTGGIVGGSNVGGGGCVGRSGGLHQSEN